MKSAPLWKISIETSPEAEEAVVELLQNIFGQPASIYVDAETGATTASSYLARIPDWSHRKRALLSEGLSKIRESGLEVDPTKMVLQRIRAEDWAESWKRHFKPIVIGSALLIKPTWSKRRAKKAQAVVVLDPGLSFGTGQHPTTRFCLEQLVGCRQPGKTQAFLDIGAGSGILAIAAAKLGYRPVEAFDFDPDAIRIARDNARQNHVFKQLRLACQDLTRLPLTSSQKYDVICANLVPALLLAEKKRIWNRLKPHGTLVLAGILRSQFEAVRTDYEKSSLRLVARAVDGEWESVAFSR